MSSMRNAVQRRPHRERAQPHERRRLGLLEKHKDYSLRAKDYNKKKQQLKSLREKAAERNEDEFYFGMMSRKGPGSFLRDGRSWSGTLHGDRGNQSLDMDTVRLLKTQDMGYVRTMKQAVTKEVARLEQQVVLTAGVDRLDEIKELDVGDVDDDEFDIDIDEPKQPQARRKIIFADTEDDRDEIIHKQVELAVEADEEKNDQESDSEKEEEELRRQKSVRQLQRELEHARKKLKVLTTAERELEVQRAKMAKTPTSGGETRRGKKLKVRERKR